MPRETPPPTARTSPPSGAARRGSRRAPEAPAPERERPPGWLAFVAGAGLTVLAYGALHEPDPVRKPVKTATGAVRPSPRQEDGDRDESAVRSSQRTRDTRDTRDTLAEVDAALPFEELVDVDAILDEARSGASPPPDGTRARADAGASAPVLPAIAAPSPVALPSPVLALPPGHPSLGEAAGAEEAPAEAAPAEEVTRTTVRHVEVTVISRWQQPGMCEKSGPAAAARRTMMARFQRVKWEPNAILFLDPRLPFGTQRNLPPQLEAAERAIAEQLDLHPSRPDVFAYRDTQLLLAGGCTNENVVAYYDGDLHVVPTHADVQQSITHEYTHHALMTSGLVAPAWAQEGIAMNVARETWWQTSDWLERVAARPFSIDVMERTVPYTMTSEQSLAFYVQSAAMVWCSTLDDPEGLRGLVRKLISSGSALDYELPPLAEPSSLRACAREILDAASEAP